MRWQVAGGSVSPFFAEACNLQTPTPDLSGRQFFVDHAFFASDGQWLFLFKCVACHGFF